MNTPAHDEPNPTWNPHAAIAGWLLPGLGHWVLGQRKRGVILLATIGLLWLAGWAISGISGFDRHDHFAWYLGQSLMAPSVAVEYAHQQIKAKHGRPSPYQQDPAYEPSFGRVSEQGILFTALAGLLNLLAIMDVAYCDAQQRRRPVSARAEPEPDAPAGEPA